MRIPQWFKPAFWGAVVGAVGIMIIGFSSWGWMLGSTAERMAKERADSAVAAILAPICVERFMKEPDKLAEFHKTASWQQRQFVEKSGWATVPGSKAPHVAAVNACIEQLAKTKN